MTGPFPQPSRPPVLRTARASIDFSGPEWHTEPDVALVDAHQLTNDRGEVQLNVDGPFLEAVAANNNRRYYRTGDATPGVIGHTTDSPADPEKPVRCWFTEFKVRPGPDGKPTLYAHQHVKRKHINILEDYPRRSIELWVGKQEIDPVALLGGTTPERDLGVTRYERNAEPVIRYAGAEPVLCYQRARSRDTVYRLESPMPANYPSIESLLSPNGPARHNGQGQSPLRYSHFEPGDSPGGESGGDGGQEGGDPMIAKLLASADFKSAIRSIFEELLSEEGGEDPGMGAEAGMPPGAGPGGPMPPGMPGMAPMGGPPGPPIEEGRGMHEAPPVRFEEGGGDMGAYPSGDNGFIPDDCGTTRGKSMQYARSGYPGYAGQPNLFDDAERGYLPPVDSQARRRLSRVEAENQELKLRLARSEAKDFVTELQKHYTIANPEYLAQQLAAFDFVPNGVKARNEFIEKVVKVNFARREHDPTTTVDLMRFSRSPAQAQTQAQGPSSPEETQRLVRYARQNNLTDMAEAWAKMHGAAK